VNTPAWLAALGAASGFAFVLGSLYEHSRKGGTRDVEIRLQTVTRLRPLPHERDRARELIERGLRDQHWRGTL
jgi:hypothetical protein